MGSPDSGGTIGTFVKGSLVEVSSDLDGFQGAWFVAIVLETPPSCLRRNARTSNYLVEYQSLLSADGREQLRERVRFPFLRPLPPAPPPHEEVHQGFEVNDVVDAYYNDGWWVGVVCEVLEDPKAYTVVFDNPPDLIKFSSSEMRVHLDWVDGKWVKPPKKKMWQNKIGSNSSERKRGERPKSAFKEKAVKFTDSSSKAKDFEMAIVESNMVDVDEPIPICPPTVEADLILKQKMWHKKVGSNSSKRKRGERPKSVFKEKAVKLTDSSSKDKDIEMAIVESNMVDVDEPIPICPPTVEADLILKQKMWQKKVGSNSSKRKRGERPKSVFKEKTVKVKLTDSSSKDKDIEMAIVESNMVNVDEPISICPPTVAADLSICDKTVDQSSEGKGALYDVVVQVEAREVAFDNTPPKNPTLQLFESSPSILNLIQSMEVFQLMPQTPHFRPLNECNEIQREGLAIGQWINFANVAEKTSELQVDDSRGTFDGIFECLLELESHGFDINTVQSRILELQSMKENKEQLQTKLENFKCEIVDRTHKETEITASLDDAMKELKMIEEKIKVVEKKKIKLITMIEEKDSKIAKLKSRDVLVNKKLRQVEQNFKTLATSPW